MTSNKSIHTVTFILLIIGGLNWLLVGLFQMDLVATIFGDMSMIARVVYTLVGLSAVYELVGHKGCCKMCGSSSMQSMSGGMPQGGMMGR